MIRAAYAYRTPPRTNLVTLVPPSYVPQNLDSIRAWAQAEALRCCADVELVELLSEDETTVRELWRRQDGQWVRD